LLKNDFGTKFPGREGQKFTKTEKSTPYAAGLKKGPVILTIRNGKHD
jgi:hypothetical protein